MGNFFWQTPHFEHFRPYSRIFAQQFAVTNLKHGHKKSGWGNTLLGGALVKALTPQLFPQPLYFSLPHRGAPF